MLYRVLTFTLLCFAPLTATGAGLPRVELVMELDTVVPPPLAAGLRAMSLGGGSKTSPFYLDDGHEMWDPLGAGCVDAAEPSAWLPSGQRDPEAGAVCLPQPCARLLTEDEMEREVLGRSLREEEWGTYTRRQSAACATEVVWGGDTDTAIDLLPEEPVGWTEVAHSQSLAVDQAGGGTQAPGSPSTGSFRTSRGGFGGWSSARGGGSDLLPLVQDGPGQKFDGGPVDAEERKPAQRKPSDGNDRSDTGSGNEGPAPQVPQPSPVPLPGSLVMLAAAAGALRLLRR